MTTNRTPRPTTISGVDVTFYWSEAIGSWVTIPEREEMTEAELLHAEQDARAEVWEHGADWND